MVPQILRSAQDDSEPNSARPRRALPFLVMTGYLTLAAPGRAETRIKGSTFLALAAPARTEDEARAVLAAVEREHFAATHNCSAWRLHGGVWRAHDDGEPSGSAGAPILAAMDGAAVEDCVAVVTRYYGGTKLGVGGLIRAYGEAAALALAAAPRRRAVPAVRLRVRYAYDHTSAVMRVVERAGTHEVEHGYSSGGAEGEVTFALARGAEEEVREQLRESTGGEVAAETIGTTTLYLNPPVA
jgi:uncharacterized YigZ family protein